MGAVSYTHGKRRSRRPVGPRWTTTPDSGPGAEETPLTVGPHMSAIFQFQKTSKITFPHKKNRYNVRKNLRKIMEVGNDIWNTFHN
jgi:hypothetical protein